MSGHSKRFTKPIGLKVTKEPLGCLRKIADLDAKPLAEWCRDKILESIRPQSSSPSDIALMAEISATEAILIDLLCAIGRDGKISQQKAQALVDAAHNVKYKEAADLLKYAYAQFESGRLEPASWQDAGSKR